MSTLQRRMPYSSMPQPVQLELSAVEAEAEAAVTDVFDKWERLNRIVQRYEPDLHRRWTKRNREQRKKILLAAWPKMAAMHRPDFYAIIHENEAQRTTATRFRDAYLAPYINLEDLCKSKNLLLLFNSRGRHTPDTFAFRDMESQELGSRSAATIPGDLPDYSMVLTGHSTRESYGRVVSWEGGQSAWAKIANGMDAGVGEGLMVLEVQQKVLGFLVRCAEAIMPDMALDKDLAPIASAEKSDLLSEETGTEWSSLAAVYAEAPYRTPQQLDIVHLRQLASAKRAEAEDHIWTLREDPGYFQEHLQDLSVHRPECIPTRSGERHPDLRRPIFYREVVRAVVADAYAALVRWDILLQELTQLQDMRERYGDAISPVRMLPADYKVALGHVGWLVYRMLTANATSLKHAAAASPPLRMHYVRLTQDAASRVVWRQPVTNDYLLWLIGLLMDTEHSMLMGVATVLDELARFTRAAPAEHARISGYTAGTLSEMAALAEIERSLAMHQPKVLPQLRGGTADRLLKLRMELPEAIQNVPVDVDLPLADARKPFSMFDYPSWKKRTQAVHTQLCAAEADLDRFWGAVDAHFQRQRGATLHELLGEVITDREILRTPPWIEPTPEPTCAPTLPVTELFSHRYLEERTERTVCAEEPPTAKIKIKTRGNPLEAAPPDEREAAVAETTPDGTPPATFQVPRRALDVFAVLFPPPGAPRGAGDLPWKKFVYAMGSVGFRITQINGSAWLFQPAWAQERPIIFHEPHPESRIQYHHLRWHEGRLARAYGWNYRTFERAERT